MIRTLLAVAVCFAFAQDKKDDGEALFTKAEEKATKGKTFHFKASLEFKEGDKESKVAVEGWFKEGNKFKVAYSGDMGGEHTDFTAISDGKRVKGREKTADAPKDLAAELRKLCASGTPLFAVMFLASDQFEGTKDMVTISKIKLGKDDKVGDRAVKVITYAAGIKDEKEETTGTIWIDATTSALVKRELKGPKGEHLVETYETWKVDEELKDEDFALPKEK